MSKRFPRTESEIAALALRVAEGLAKAAEDFPNPPVSASELKARLEAFNAADTATVAAETEFREQHAMKDDALEDLVDGAVTTQQLLRVRSGDRRLILGLGFDSRRAVLRRTQTWRK